LNSIGYRDLARSIGRWIAKWRHPFWWLPDVPSEQDEAYRRIWANLRQVDRVVDGRHDTDDWFARPGDFVWMCARVPEAALLPGFEELVRTLEQFSFTRIVPREYLNITVQELGYLAEQPSGRDEITEEWLEEFIQHAQRPISSFPPFDVAIGGANSFVDAAFLDIHDNGWLSRIHNRLLDFVSQPPSTRYSYLPELIIAQYVQAAPIASLVRALTPFRDRTFGTFRVESIDVMRVSTSETFPEPRLVHRFELGNEPRLIDRVSPADDRAAR
jgi:2'-5' RNA ligase